MAPFETRRRKHSSWAVLMLVCGLASAQERLRSNNSPAEGYVPDGATAIKIAVAVCEPIYGHMQIASEAPYIARLKDGVWYVQGHLPEGHDGGVAEIEISKGTGEILRLSHGK